MQISPISYQSRCQIRQNTAPKFEGALNDKQVDIVLKRLSKMNSKIFEKFDIKEFNDVIEELIKRYECLGTSSVGIQVVNNNDLPKLLGKELANYNTKNKMALCVAVGNKRGPIEEMTNIYEAQTFLIDPTELSKL